MKFTIAGFEKFLNNSGNNSLFSFIEVPGNFPDDAQPSLIKAVILDKYGELEPIYADPYRLKFATEVFFRKHKLTFEKWFNAINLDYEPLYNFDRYEEWTDEGAGSKNANSNHRNSILENGNTSDADSSTGSNTRTSNISASENNREDLNHSGNNTSNDFMSISEGTTETTNSEKLSNGNSQRNTANDGTSKISAYNSVTLPDAEKEVSTGYEASANSNVENDSINGFSNRTGNNSNARSGADFSEDTKNSASSKAENETTTDSATGSTSANSSHSNVRNEDGAINSTESTASLGTHRGHLYGNIGVTTSSALLKEYLDISEWSFYDHVADLYAEELLLMIY
ncbi:MAG: hypothetical protein J5656_06830 [Clostridia bacterium]|nr:hypothetical protein [Clostridia bacterium]